jgi:hypothetical protein
MPQLVQTMRGPNAGTGIASSNLSTFIAPDERQQIVDAAMRKVSDQERRRA